MDVISLGRGNYHGRDNPYQNMASAMTLWRHKNIDRARATARSYWKRVASGVRSAKRKIPGALRREWLRNQYKVSVEWYDKKLKEQKHCCAICKRPQSAQKRPFSVDHDHKTNKPRGILCTRCNVALGAIETVKNFAGKSLSYLKKNTGVNYHNDFSGNPATGK
jgi:hypothetical protein